MDFSNRQNRFVRLSDVSPGYLASIREKAKSDPFYPRYHIAPLHGLLNDPNGLSFFNGEHHIFYQWFPLGPVHGLKHWYHVSTQDFVNFTDHGIAMYPDKEYDGHGCFTGVALPDGEKLSLFYTGNRVNQDGSVEQSQVLAYMDKNGHVEKQRVLVENDTENYTENFRDPVVFSRGADNYMLVGAEGRDGQGKLALYQGGRDHSYHYLGNLDIGCNEAGYMWECPNYYETGGRGVLIFSPQGISSENRYDYKNVFSVVYSVGDLINVEECAFSGGDFIELDKGFDFYAPQSYTDSKSRQILIGWLGNSKSEYPTDKSSWAHMLTLPRELEICGNRLLQKPLDELKQLRGEPVEIGNTTPLSGCAFELELKVDDNFSLLLGNSVQEKVVFSGCPTEYCLDRGASTHLYAHAYGQVRYAERLKGRQTIRVFVDASSVEIFCDYGATVFTSRIFIEDLSLVELTGAVGRLYYLDTIGYAKKDTQTGE